MKPNIKKHLNQAEEILREMQHLITGNFYKGVRERAYYAMFHAATAAMLAKEIKGKSGQAIVSTFAGGFVKTGLLDKKYHRYFQQAANLRTKSDYTSFDSADHRQAQRNIVISREFVAACRKLCK